MPTTTQHDDDRNGDDRISQLGSTTAPGTAGSTTIDRNSPARVHYGSGYSRVWMACGGMVSDAYSPPLTSV